jgi:hypothetical protein
MGRNALVKEALTHSVIGCFFEVYKTLKYGLLESLYSRQACSYLRASNLELGLLLHFGPDPKFYRVYLPNDPGTGR